MRLSSCSLPNVVQQQSGGSLRGAVEQLQNKYSQAEPDPLQGHYDLLLDSFVWIGNLALAWVGAAALAQQRIYIALAPVVSSSKFVFLNCIHSMT